MEINLIRCLASLCKQLKINLYSSGIRFHILDFGILVHHVQYCACSSLYSHPIVEVICNKLVYGSGYIIADSFIVTCAIANHERKVKEFEVEKFIIASKENCNGSLSSSDQNGLSKCSRRHSRMYSYFSCVWVPKGEEKQTKYTIQVN